MNTLPVTIGILSWRSNKSIRNTLESYRKNGLLRLVKQKIMFLQEYRDEDVVLAQQYGFEVIQSTRNVGIGKAFMQLAEAAKQPYVLLLEHDWELVESFEFTRSHLSDAINYLSTGGHCVRLRHRYKYGYPHYSIARYKGRELDFYDDWIEMKHPHLLDAVHWKSVPHELWPDKISKQDDFFIASSRYANWTNNPCLYRTDFYKQCVEEHIGEGIDLERNISHWWARQGFGVAQGRGLFQHKDIDKYPFSYHLKRRIKSVLGRS